MEQQTNTKEKPIATIKPQYQNVEIKTTGYFKGEYNYEYKHKKKRRARYYYIE